MIALAMIDKQVRDLALALRLCVRSGFSRNGQFASGYRRRIKHLRAHRSTLARELERGE